MKMPKLIINLAPTGMVPDKADNPHVPLTPEEIAETCHRCYQAGASIFHLHARDQEGSPTYRIEVYRDIISRVRSRCQEAIICVSTSGRVYTSFAERSQVLDLDGEEKPDMASLTLGSHNFPRQASLNEPAMIKALAQCMQERGIVPELEIFDLGMIDFALYLIKKKVLREPFYFNLLLGSLGTLSATPYHLATMARSLPSGATWTGSGIGRFQFYVNSMAITMGGHVRVGLEDNLYLDQERSQTASNLSLVERLVGVARAINREIATPGQARKIIGLEPRSAPGLLRTNLSAGGRK
jgi:3-oxoadipate:acetyl-CoA acetyltransferase